MNALQKWKRQEYERERQSRPIFDTFDDYVKAFPEAEKYRRWVENGILLPTYEGYCGMPGDYVTASIHNWKESWFVIVNDCDDGSLRLTLKSRQDAEKEIGNLRLLAPFMMSELRDFGYHDDY